MPNSESSTGVLPVWVTATAPLNIAQRNISYAYFVLLGRAPDRAGLAYWTGALGSGVTLTAAVDAIAGVLAASRSIDPDAGELVRRLYWTLLGKTYDDDPAGQAYWTAAIQTSGKTIGYVTQAVYDIVQPSSGWIGDTMRNRLYVVEAMTRVQLEYARDMPLPDLCSIGMRTDGALASFYKALNDIYRVAVQQSASPTVAWDTAYTTTSFLNECRRYDNTPQLQHRRLAWFNRQGHAMYAYAVLPATATAEFFLGSNYKVVILWHGGGWRIGHPAQVYWHAEALARRVRCVVLCPNYRLSTFGWKTPSHEQDVSDFYALVKSSASDFLRRDASKVALMGESAGGHLSCLVGSQQDVWRVLGIYPSIDLVEPISAELDAYYVSQYTTPAQAASCSPSRVWTPARTTKFELWHGDSDPLVPLAQSQKMKTKVGANCTVHVVPGEGHAFSLATRDALILSATDFFS